VHKIFFQDPNSNSSGRKVREGERGRERKRK
jgi:hypothetical protein